jgi:L-ascorbate metabolism protein UlaG (beta-lactamase superfamily)
MNNLSIQYMKITSIGLSCYLIENKNKARLLIDPFSDLPEHSFGLTLPKNLSADIFLASHADEDHSNLNGKFARHLKNSNKKDTTKVTPFPHLDLKGTIVKEYNGDLCIAYHFTLDNKRFLHLSDNSHPLTKNQLKEIGKIDILFLPMPKSKSDNIKMEKEIIKKLNPKIVIPTHLISLPVSEINKGFELVEKKISKIILPEKKNPSANKITVNIFTYMLLATKNLINSYPSIEIESPTIKIDKLPKKTTIYHFTKYLSK